MGQFCIDHHLAAALSGDVDHGLFFRGSESVPFGSAIRPVRELVDLLLGRAGLTQVNAGKAESAKMDACPSSSGSSRSTSAVSA